MHMLSFYQTSSHPPPPVLIEKPLPPGDRDFPIPAIAKSQSRPLVQEPDSTPKISEKPRKKALTFGGEVKKVRAGLHRRPEGPSHERE